MYCYIYAGKKLKQFLLVCGITKKLHPEWRELFASWNLAATTLPSLFSCRFFQTVRNVCIPNHINFLAALTANVRYEDLFCIIIKGVCSSHRKTMDEICTVEYLAVEQ